MHHPTLCALAVGILAAVPGAQAGLYTKKSPVLQVDGKDYDRLIAKSNQTSIVEFYAPWCGHCQNLKPAYEKAAKNLEGLAKVAAVNCDDDANKPFCGSMGVQGFPTLKIVRPGKKAGSKPMVEDYQGQRTASAIVDAVVSRINNHVVKVEDKNLDKFLSDKNETAKALLFTDKGTTSALLKSVAIDFLDVITVGQVRNTQSKAVSTFGVDKFPTLILLPGGDAPGIVYDGEIKKVAMVKFLSQAGQPNPDPAPAKAKNGKKDSKKEKSASSAFSSASTKAKSSASASSSSTSSSSSETPASTQEAPVIVNTALPIPTLNTPEKLTKECLTSKSNTCVLAFVSSSSSSGEKAQQALKNLAELAFKHAHSNRKLFPFFEIPLSTNSGGSDLLKALDLKEDAEIEIIAINARRGWWRHYDSVSISDDFSGHDKLEAWIDAIRMGEGAKRKLPEGIAVESVKTEEESSKAEKAKPEEAVADEETTPEATKAITRDEKEAPVTPEASSETAANAGEEEEESTAPVDPTPEPETAAHDEL